MDWKGPRSPKQIATIAVCDPIFHVLSLLLGRDPVVATGSCDPVSRRAPRQHLPTTARKAIANTVFFLVCCTTGTSSPWNKERVSAVCQDGELGAWQRKVDLQAALIQVTDFNDLKLEGNNFGHSDFEGFKWAKAHDWISFSSREKRGRIQTKEGFARILPNRYGPSSSLSDLGVPLETGAPEQDAKQKQKITRKADFRTFLNLAFYNAPSFHIVSQRAPLY